jgi:hypothetical protein
MPADVISLLHPGTVFLPIRDKLEPIRFTAAWRRDDDRSVVNELITCLKDANRGVSPETQQKKGDRQPPVSPFFYSVFTPKSSGLTEP